MLKVTHFNCINRSLAKTQKTKVQRETRKKKQGFVSNLCPHLDVLYLFYREASNLYSDDCFLKAQFAGITSSSLRCDFSIHYLLSEYSQKNCRQVSPQIFKQLHIQTSVSAWVTRHSDFCHEATAELSFLCAERSL